MEWMVLIVPVVVVGLAIVIVSRGSKHSTGKDRTGSSRGEGFVYGTDAGHHHGRDHEVEGARHLDQPAYDATPDMGSDGGGFDSGGGDSGGGGGDGGSD